MGLALDGEGNVYVSDDERNDVQVFSPDGNFLRKFGGYGRGEGQINGAATSPSTVRAQFGYLTRRTTALTDSRVTASRLLL